MDGQTFTSFKEAVKMEKILTTSHSPKGYANNTKPIHNIATARKAEESAANGANIHSNVDMAEPELDPCSSHSQIDHNGEKSEAEVPLPVMANAQNGMVVNEPIIIEDHLMDDQLIITEPFNSAMNNEPAITDKENGRHTFTDSIYSIIDQHMISNAPTTGEQQNIFKEQVAANEEQQARSADDHYNNIPLNRTNVSVQKKAVLGVPAMTESLSVIADEGQSIINKLYDPLLNFVLLQNEPEWLSLENAKKDANYSEPADKHQSYFADNDVGETVPNNTKNVGSASTDSIWMPSMIGEQLDNNYLSFGSIITDALFDNEDYVRKYLFPLQEGTFYLKYCKSRHA
ncbi:hypothetical protein Bhyg_03199 [Pseudolycoriella hygida]|uniref:Uncharacterized protein n=1 Tax=Pseudolycoriella hygida TaxID=35572 RepID=A0A9Q0NEN6_9DIPT|nr:hypothetical protein Bhyg_03199 [Pseudolycoriella hygida]